MAETKRILVIDDDVQNIQALSETLRKAGYGVETAADGLHGLTIARETHPDMVILDVVLPKLSGYKVSRFLKFDETFKHIPVVFVSQKAEKADREVGMEVGASAYLTKPAKPEELLETVRIQLGLNSLS